MKLPHQSAIKRPHSKTPAHKDIYSTRLSNQPQTGFHEGFRTSDEFFRQLVESLEDYAVFTTDIKGNISSWNRGAKKIFGYTEKELLGKNSSVLFVKQDLKNNIAQKELYTALKKGKSIGERWHMRKDTSKFWGSNLVFPLYDSEKNVRGFTKVTRDLTDRKVARDQEKKFRSVIENSSDGIRLIDRNGKITYASPSTKRILGYNPKEYVNQKIIDLIHKDDKKIYRDTMRKILDNPGSSVHLTYQIKHKDGTYRWMEGVGTNLLDDPAVNAIVSNFRDITERKDLERRKDEFVSMASHELKTPITSLNLFTDMLKKNAQEKKYDSIPTFAKKIRQQTSKLTEIVNDLLDVSRIETGKMRFRTEKFNLSELLHDIVDDMQYTTHKHKIVCIAKQPMLITADRYRIYQVLTNLLTNAIKYSPENTQITVTLKKQKNFALVSVADKGIGISKDQHKNIFDKLYQVGDSKEKTFPGLGMGLYISKEIITRHNGKIWVKSKGKSIGKKPGNGSTFYFTLPLNV
ncbi:MAG TPA: PAS domain S-box protein [Candidatus Levybacteria bacterium]|nr:PAS domain S-box protein [Candidatus Levybacteria bacterium]